MRLWLVSVWTQKPSSWLWLLSVGKESSASSCFQSDAIWYLLISDTWLWKSTQVPVQVMLYPQSWWVLWFSQFSQVQIPWSHSSSIFLTLPFLIFPVKSPNCGLEPSPEITARDANLALPVERGGCFCGFCQTSMLEAGFQIKSAVLNFYPNEIRTHTT